MAAFIAKQMVGNKLGAVKGAMGGGDKEEDKEDGEEGEEDPEIAEARREAEEKRKEKHRKLEEEREIMRQGIRDKYGIKKKEEQTGPVIEPDVEGRLGRKKKTPEEMAAEAAAAEEEEDSILPPGLNDLTTKVKDLPNNVMESVSGVTEKCSVM